MSSKIDQNIHRRARSPRFEVQIAGGDDCNSGVAAWECVLFFMLMTLDHMKTEDTCRGLRMPEIHWKWRNIPVVEKLLFLKGPNTDPTCLDG